MSAVALQPIQELRASLTLTPDLAVWVCAVEDGAEPPEGLPPAVVAEAQRLADRAEQLLQPVPEHVLRTWLAMISVNYLARRPMEEKNAAAWRASIINDFHGMPVGVFTMANKAEVNLNYTFLPATAEINKVLMPDRDNLERRARALRAVAATKENM